MQSSLVISILAADRPGVVESLSQVINSRQASWEESRMTQLAGKFAGLLLVSVPDQEKDALIADLQALESDDFRLLIEATGDSETATSKRLNLELLGQDRPGIIHDVTQQLAKLNVNIEQLESEIRQASMSGGTLFQATLELSLPADIDPATVQDTLEAMSDQFMVDLNFES